MHFIATLNPLALIKITESIFEIVEGTDSGDITGIKTGNNGPERFTFKFINPFCNGARISILAHKPVGAEKTDGVPGFFPSGVIGMKEDIPNRSKVSKEDFKDDRSIKQNSFAEMEIKEIDNQKTY
jgi:hypothetical protein